jgi:serine/threonine protein kinase
VSEPSGTEGPPEGPAPAETVSAGPSAPVPTPEPGAGRVPAPERGEALAGRYVLEKEVGRGGTGVVYRVFDIVARRTVALKLMDGAGLSSISSRERLYREVRYGRSVLHSHVRRVFDVFEAEGRCFVTMEYAAGGSLREVVGAAGTRPWSDRLADARAVVAGLAAIHAAGLVHGDLKPENVLRMDDGRLVVSDFGLSRAMDRMTARTGAGGTPGYLAPELARGEAVSQAADVWSLGVVLHEIFFGVRPVWVERRGGARPRMGDGRGRPSRLEDAAARLCAACLADSPAARPASAQAVVHVLEEALRGRPKRALRRLGATTVLGLVGLAALVFGGWTVLARWRPDPVPGTVVGTAADWSDARILLETGGANCLLALPPDGRKVRIISSNTREAVDVDVRTGQISPSPLLPDTHRWGCPQLSPDGRSLIFTKREGAESLIMFSSHPDGREAVRVTEGMSPAWLPSGREFLFVAERARIARGSLDGERVLFPASAETPAQITHVTPDEKGERAVAIFSWGVGRYSLESYSLPSLTHLGSLPIDSARVPMAVAFDPVRSKFQLSLSEQDSYTWVEGAGSGRLLRLGRAFSYGGVLRAVRTEAGLAFQAWQEVRELALVLGDGLIRPVADRASEARVSRRGDVVFVSDTLDGRRVIGLRRLQDTETRLLTTGPMDRNPDLSSDGASLAYYQASEHAIAHCLVARGYLEECVKIQSHGLPFFVDLRLSPDGKKIAYTGLLEGQYVLRGVSVQDGHSRDLGSMKKYCGMHWASDDELWTLSPDTSGWIEIKALSGRPTGRTLDTGPLSDNSCPPPPPDENRFRVRQARPSKTRIQIVSGI